MRKRFFLLPIATGVGVSIVVTLVAFFIMAFLQGVEGATDYMVNNVSKVLSASLPAGFLVGFIIFLMLVRKNNNKVFK